MDGGIDLVHARGGKSVEIFSQFFSSLFGKAHGYGGKIGVFARFDLPDHDITDDIVVVQNGRKTFQQSGVARIDVAPVRLFARRKCKAVAFFASRVHDLVRAQTAAEIREFFGIIAKFVFRIVVNTYFDFRQVIKVVQEFLHFLQIVRLHISIP